jgi:hypothetical protein
MACVVIREPLPLGFAIRGVDSGETSGALPGRGPGPARPFGRAQLPTVTSEMGLWLDQVDRPLTWRRVTALGHRFSDVSAAMLRGGPWHMTEVLVVYKRFLLDQSFRSAASSKGCSPLRFAASADHRGGGRTMGAGACSPQCRWSRMTVGRHRPGRRAMARWIVATGWVSSLRSTSKTFEAVGRRAKLLPDLHARGVRT